MNKDKIKEFIEKNNLIFDELEKDFDISRDQIIDNLFNLIDTKNAIELKDLSVSYEKNNLILKNLNFAIEKGTFNAFIGQNGAGKSTTIKTIIGTLKPISGDILIFDRTLKTNLPQDSILSFCPEETIFPNNLNVFDFLYLTIGLTRGYNKTIKNEILEALTFFDLIKFKKRKPKKLSTGQKKSIMLLSTILKRPKIIILDEPMVNLDIKTKTKFFNELKKLQALGSTILFSTHQLDEIKKYAEKIIFIEKGRIIYSGDFDDKYIQYYSNEP